MWHSCIASVVGMSVQAGGWCRSQQFAFMFKWLIFENLAWQMKAMRACIFWACPFCFFSCAPPEVQCAHAASPWVMSFRWAHRSPFILSLIPILYMQHENCQDALRGWKTPTFISNDDLYMWRKNLFFYHSWASPVILTGDLTHSRHSLNVEWPFCSVASFFSSWSLQRTIRDLPSSLASSSAV